MLFDLDPDRFAFLKPFALGAAGGLVSLRLVPGLSYKEKAFNLLCGALTAGFLTDATTELLQLQSKAMWGATAFLLGVFGMNVLATANAWLRELKLSDVLPWFRKE